MHARVVECEILPCWLELAEYLFINTHQKYCSNGARIPVAKEETTYLE